jgi:hypothetical protein
MSDLSRRVTFTALVAISLSFSAGCSTGYTRYDGTLRDCTNSSIDGDALLFYLADQDRPKIVLGFRGAGTGYDSFFTVEIDDPQVSDASMSGEASLGNSAFVSIDLDIIDDRLDGNASFDSTNGAGEVLTERCDATFRLAD